MEYCIVRVSKQYGRGNLLTMLRLQWVIVCPKQTNQFWFPILFTYLLTFSFLVLVIDVLILKL